MKNVSELARLNSPFPKPQALAAEGATLWLSSRATRKIYAVDRATLAVRSEVAVADGLIAWGLAAVGGELRVTCGGEGGDDDVRTIRRYAPGQGFDRATVWPCPENSGSHLAHDGQTLWLSQWYPRKLVAIGSDGTPGRVIQLPRQVVGQCFARGAFWLATTTDEESDEYFVERCDPASGECVMLGRLGFSARALAFDGTDFWTNHREANQIVRFALPG